MNRKARQLVTRRGTIRFPAYFPVTTFGEKYPLDRLIRPYLNRLAPGAMVSYHYAKQIDECLRIPLLIDSGGFASLLPGASVESEGNLGILALTREGRTERTHPARRAGIAGTNCRRGIYLGFSHSGRHGPAGGSATAETDDRQRGMGVSQSAAARLAVVRLRPRLGRVQRPQVARTYAGCGFDGVAIGGLVPRARDTELVLDMVRAVREEIGELPLHVFGLGKPEMMEKLIRAGVDSIDSSSHIKLAAQGRSWAAPKIVLADASPTQRLHLALANLAFAAGKTLPLPAWTTLLGPFGLGENFRMSSEG